MPRPKLKVKVHRFDINMTLHEGADDDLIAFFKNIPRRQRVTAVKMALRSGTMQLAIPSDGPDDDELAAALDELIF